MLNFPFQTDRSKPIRFSLWAFAVFRQKFCGRVELWFANWECGWVPLYFSILN